MNNKFIPYEYVNIRTNTHISFTWDAEVRTSLFVPLKNGSTSLQRWFRNDLRLTPDTLGWNVYDPREETQDLDEHPWFTADHKYIVIRKPYDRFKSAMTTVAQEFNQDVALDSFYRTWYDHVAPVLTPLVRAIQMRQMDMSKIKFIRMENLNMYCPYHDNKTNWRTVNESKETAPYVRILSNMNKHMLDLEELAYCWLCNNLDVAESHVFKNSISHIQSNINDGEPLY